jgi:phosphoglycolate phosphatase
VTAVFYNGVGWNAAWLRKIFPRTPRHPHGPDLVVRSLGDLARRVQRLRAA